MLNWLGTLDWEAGWRGSMANSPHPEKDIEVDDWVIGLTALPMPPEAHGDEEARMVALFRGTGGYPDGLGREILPKLERKANKYGDLDVPHVVALWVMDAMASERTAPLALFGTGITTKPGVHLTGLPPLSGKPVGLWVPGAKNRGRASAVLAVDSMSFNYSAASRVLPHLWLNPWADHQLEVDLPYASSRVSNDEASVENLPAATTASELFGLPEDWPGRPFEARRQRRAGTRDEDSA